MLFFGTVQIHQMEMSDAGILEFLSDLYRIFIVHFRLRIVTLRQSHTFSVDDIDGRNDFHFSQKYSGIKRNWATPPWSFFSRDRKNIPLPFSSGALLFPCTHKYHPRESHLYWYKSGCSGKIP